MTSASDKRFFGAMATALGAASIADAEHALEETAWWAVHALRERDDESLRSLATECNALGQRYRTSSDQWQAWCAGQLQMIAVMCRSALSLQVPRTVAVAVRERKNFLPILQMIGERDVDASTIASEAGLNLSQTLRELAALEELKLVQTDKGIRRRWVRVTPLGHQTMVELGASKPAVVVAERVGEMLEGAVAEPVRPQVEVGQVVSGTVSRLVEFGAFVDIGAGVDGLVHITNLAPHRINHPSEVVATGDVVKVKVLKIEGKRISLSMNDVPYESAIEHAREVLQSEAAPDTEIAQALEKAVLFDLLER